ncbi:hypothetical protein ABEB36_014892 [Hypothenemus hampei]|uniref:Uncharacterized protein n=1 Tax=Hypothenemus hampei TaxID=57062 RepID=A0ABD1E3X4_HYPHA
MTSIHQIPFCSKNLPLLYRSKDSASHDIILITQVQQTDQSNQFHNRVMTAVLTANPYYQELKPKNVFTPKRLTTTIKRKVFPTKDEGSKKRKKLERKDNKSENEIDHDIHPYLRTLWFLTYDK